MCNNICRTINFKIKMLNVEQRNGPHASFEFLSDMCLGGLEEGNFSLALVLEVLMFGYAFIGLAIVCDDYLVMSLEQVNGTWNKYVLLSSIISFYLVVCLPGAYRLQVNKPIPDTNFGPSLC